MINIAITCHSTYSCRTYVPDSAGHLPACLCGIGSSNVCPVRDEPPRFSRGCRRSQVPSTKFRTGWPAIWAAGSHREDAGEWHEAGGQNMANQSKLATARSENYSYHILKDGRGLADAIIFVGQFRYFFLRHNFGG